MLEERDPFAGLCAEHPDRAYAALVHAAEKGDYPEWAWDSFLTSTARQDDEPEFSRTVALRLSSFPNKVLQQLMYSSTSWLHKIGKGLSCEFPDTFDEVTSKLIDVVLLDPSQARSGLVDVRKDRDWATAALNSPVGHIALAILEDSRLKKIEGAVDPSANWLTQLERLLGLAAR